MSPEEAAAFVKECEEKFANRYTEKDPEYARVCKTLTTGSVPPLIPHRPSNNDYSINYITKKEPKSDNHLSKFDWHDLSPIFFGHNTPS